MSQLLILPSFIKNAHTTTERPWILVNTKALEESTLPPTSHLFYPVHVFNDKVEVGSELKMEIKPEVIIFKYGVLSNEVAIKTYLYDSFANILNEYSGTDISLATNIAGSIFVKVVVNKDTDTLETETFKYDVGTFEKKLELSIGGEKIGDGDTYKISFSKNYQFLATGIDSDNFYWDFGDGKNHEGSDALINFSTIKLPVYVTARRITSEGFIEDQYIRIDSTEENVFQIPPPPVLQNPDIPLTNSSINILPIAISLIAIVGIVALFVYRRRNV